MRKNISIGDKALARLESLRERVEATSTSEVIRDALRLYEYIVGESDKGAEFFVKRPKEDMSKLEIFL
jgi:Arc/MetJ-type ribon-helix-helix transcriptional regulator